MNYAKVYSDFIADRQNKEAAVVASGVYTEKHHVLPRSLGGGDEAANLVSLTAGDHYFAHLLLAKVHGGTQWAGVWALLGLSQNGTRSSDLTWLRGRKLWVTVAREKAAKLSRGANNKQANKTVYTWVNEHTGETLVGTRHDLPVNHAAKKEVSDYFLGKTFTTASGFFTTDRFGSVEELKAARKAKAEKAAATGKAQAAKQRGSNNPNSVSVVCLDNGVTYASVADAVAALGLPNSARSKVGEVCRGQRKTTAGYRFAYA